MMKTPALLLFLFLASVPGGYWTAEQARAVLDKTQEIRLAPDLSALSAGERNGLDKLIEVGRIAQAVYEESRHRQTEEALARLGGPAHGETGPRLEPAHLDALRRLYRLNQGPIATTLDNQRVPFLPVDPPAPGKNVYPWGVTREEMDRFLAAHPEERDRILDPRTVVRRATAANLERDRAALRRHPVLEALHPGLRARVSVAPDETRFYAVPYPVAWANEMVRAHGLLMSAADDVTGDDPELAGYLRNRARDLLSNDYESGDAAWVTGRFGRLNAQIGAYETYDDGLFGAKAFFAVSLLLRDEKATAPLRDAIRGLQDIENSLPYGAAQDPPASPKRIREDIPVGVYDVIADFGQARGTNTATILPNDALYARRYGRTILLRANIMRNPDIHAGVRSSWQAAVADAHDADLGPDGDFQRTLWHEIGHYLGVDRDRSGRDLDAALQENAPALEEMKADLVSLFAARALRARGYYDDDALRAVYAAGIRRTLQGVKPRREQPYQTMQLMQMNYFLENGLLRWDAAGQALEIRYDRYHDVVTALLREVLAVQHAGDKAASDRFIERWTSWSPDLHEPLAAQMRAATPYRFRIVRYAALGE
jgi:hypothetical protein